MARGDRKAKKQEPSVLAKPKKEFPRRLWGYRRKDVDHRLAEIDASIGLLQVQVDAAQNSAAHHDLVLRATRRSVEEVLERANAEAAAIRAAAEADASRVLADAYELVQARDAAVIDLRAAARANEAADIDDDAELFAPDPADP